MLLVTPSLRDSYDIYGRLGRRLVMMQPAKRLRNAANRRKQAPGWQAEKTVLAPVALPAF